MASLSAVRDKRSSGRLPPAEARLLLQINRGLSDVWWDHYHQLVEKRQDGTLSTAEHQELIRLTNGLERREARRLQALVKLAKLRKQSLADVMTALGLPGKNDG